MAGIGPAPKDPSQRRRRNADIAATTVLPAEGPQGSTPELPGNAYDARTMAWYETWRTSPQATVFVATDWQRLHMLAELVQQYWEEPRKELLSEIRLNEAALGATAADRIRLRWTVAQAEEEQRGGSRVSRPRSSASRRDRILRAVDGSTED
ncbi:hypothetical protein OG747_36745 [Streptomyces sp. NBC_01384]|uniref:phage terminase small subunit n=1 Tax=Streptomyces sp. NBC_01384 TaxID=2903847 RepID=UPI00325453E5